jgi:hypothetical protein
MMIERAISLRQVSIILLIILVKFKILIFLKNFIGTS